MASISASDDLDAGRIGVVIDLASHLQAGLGGRGGDQLDDDLMADERFAAPVSGDEREQAMLDLVPLAGAGRQVADRDGECRVRRPAFAARSSTGARATPLLPPPSAVISRLRGVGIALAPHQLATSAGWR